MSSMRSRIYGRNETMSACRIPLHSGMGPYMGELSQRSGVQALFGAGSGGYPGIHRVQLYLGSLCHFMVEVTLPTLGLLCHHEDDGAQAIGCLVHRLAPALRVRPPGTVTRRKRHVRDCPIPASTHVGLTTWIRREAR
jgi:hypothetical protein